MRQSLTSVITNTTTFNSSCVDLNQFHILFDQSSINDPLRQNILKNWVSGAVSGETNDSTNISLLTPRFSYVHKQWTRRTGGECDRHLRVTAEHAGSFGWKMRKGWEGGGGRCGGVRSEFLGRCAGIAQIDWDTRLQGGGICIKFISLPNCFQLAAIKTLSDQRLFSPLFSFAYINIQRGKKGGGRGGYEQTGCRSGECGSACGCGYCYVYVYESLPSHEEKI